MVIANPMAAQGEDPDELGPNEFRAGSLLTLNCTLWDGTGQLMYEWAKTPAHSCSGCETDLPASSTLTLPLYSTSAGHYNCSVNGSFTSQPFTVTVIGKSLYPVTQLYNCTAV